jgi:lipoprotein-anchoring transpeptidase ErfK/SrfK
VAALLVLLVLCGAGASAAVWKSQQSDLTSARSDRTAAQSALDSAISHAESDGLAKADLLPVTTQRTAILAEAAVATKAFGFDGGERTHLAHQAGALRALIARVDLLQQGFTDIARGAATTLLDQMQAAIATAKGAGIEVGGESSTLDQTRAALAAAKSPKAVQTAIIGIDTRISALQTQTQVKLAADAALSSSRTAAQSALARADRLVSAVQPYPNLQPTIRDWAAAITAQHQAFLASTDMAGFDAITAATTAAANPIDDLLTSRSGAYGDMASARQSVQDAINYKVDPGDIPHRLDVLQATLDGASTTAVYEFVMNQVDGMMPPLLDRIGIASLGVGKVIVISLARQELTAYQDGVPFITTLVTTGRPELPTPPGNYTVLRKNHPWKMTSDFPPSSPYWYAPTWVQYTLWFRSDGYAIHDAPWRGTYGPGTQAAGSHGCVNTPMPTMVDLFNWAELGTRVIVH